MHKGDSLICISMIRFTEDGLYKVMTGRGELKASRVEGRISLTKLFQADPSPYSIGDREIDKCLVNVTRSPL